MLINNLYSNGEAIIIIWSILFPAAPTLKLNAQRIYAHRLILKQRSILASPSIKYALLKKKA